MLFLCHLGFQAVPLHLSRGDHSSEEHYGQDEHPEVHPERGVPSAIVGRKGRKKRNGNTGWDQERREVLLVTRQSWISSNWASNVVHVVVNVCSIMCAFVPLVAQKIAQIRLGSAIELIIPPVMLRTVPAALLNKTYLERRR